MTKWKRVCRKLVWILSEAAQKKISEVLTGRFNVQRSG